jgi:hypothetical protein
MGDVCEAETSPLITRFAGPPAAEVTSVDDDDVDDGETGAISEGDVQAFARTAFGAVASPYLSPFVQKRGVLDSEYGLRKEGNKFFIGNSDVTVDTNSDLYIKDKHFRGTRDFWKLLTRKIINNKPVTADEMKQYKRILNLTSAHTNPRLPYTSCEVSNSKPL